MSFDQSINTLPHFQ